MIIIFITYSILLQIQHVLFLGQSLISYLRKENLIMRFNKSYIPIQLKKFKLIKWFLVLIQIIVIIIIIMKAIVILYLVNNGMI